MMTREDRELSFYMSIFTGFIGGVVVLFAKLIADSAIEKGPEIINLTNQLVIASMTLLPLTVLIFLLAYFHLVVAWKKD